MQTLKIMKLNFLTFNQWHSYTFFWGNKRRQSTVETRDKARAGGEGASEADECDYFP